MKGGYTEAGGRPGKGGRPPGAWLKLKRQKYGIFSAKIRQLRFQIFDQDRSGPSRERKKPSSKFRTGKDLFFFTFN
jgi:hypothetical protein